MTVIQFKPYKDRKDAEKTAFMARQWGDVYTEALGCGFDMEQAMDVADSVTADMWSSGIGQGNLTVSFDLTDKS